MDTYLKKTQPERKNATVTKTTDAARQIPNSARPGALDNTQGDSGLEGFLESKLSRIREDSRAENEADSYASSAAGASSVGEVKARLGRRMGADFSSVRVHTGSDAGEKARGLGARAFAQGKDVFMGNFDPEITAHELVHTVQQGDITSVGGSPTISMAEGSVQLWPWSKKTKTPGQLKVTGDDGKAAGKVLKGEPGAGATVMKFGEESGKGSGIVKTATDVDSEVALSAFYNAGGLMHASTTDDEDKEWTFDAPVARRLMAGTETDDIRGLYHSGELVNNTKVKAADPLQQALDMTTVYSEAAGKTVYEKDQYGADPEMKGGPKAKDLLAPIAAGTDSKYHQMQGYIAMMDMLTGNGDRLTDLYNTTNWMEDRKKKQVHLIDNLDMRDGSLGVWASDEFSPTAQDKAAERTKWEKG